MLAAANSDYVMSDCSYRVSHSDINSCLQSSPRLSSRLLSHWTILSQQCNYSWTSFILEIIKFRELPHRDFQTKKIVLSHPMPLIKMISYTLRASNYPPVSSLESELLIPIQYLATVNIRPLDSLMWPWERAHFGGFLRKINWETIVSTLSCFPPLNWPPVNVTRAADHWLRSFSCLVINGWIRFYAWFHVVFLVNSSEKKRAQISTRLSDHWR